MRLRPARNAPWVLALVLFAAGVPLVAGGVELAWLGGSWYYVTAGIALIVASGLLWRARRAGMWLYLLLVLGTLLWSVWEIGADGWALASRMGAPLLLALVFLLPSVRRRLS